MSACHRNGYPNRQAALSAMIRQQRQHHSAPVKRAFRCPWCRIWHLTTRKRRSR